MVNKYCEVIDGKQIPTWALKPVNELSDHDVKARARWKFVCQIAPDVFGNPKDYVEHIKYTLELAEKAKRNPAAYNFFIYWNSDDYFYMKCKSDRKLDEKIKDIAPLSDFTLRQVVNAMYVIASGYLDDKSIEHLKDYTSGALEYSMSV